MTKKNKLTPPTDLRRTAEDLLKARQAAERAAAPGRGNNRQLQHELEVHQIELELQNEELRQARRETEASLERYLGLFDFGPLGYAILDRAGNITEINHAGASLVGKPRSRLVGLPFETFVSLDDRPTFRKFVGRTLKSGVRETCELELMRGYSDRIQAHLTAAGLSRGEQMILLAFEDVTERKTREQKLADTESALRVVDRRKDDFLAMLSHELRNPLGAMRNSMRILLRGDREGEKARRARSIIDRQVSLLTRIVDDLLDVTRIARGKIELHRQRLELGELARRTMDDHRQSFEAAGLRLEARLEPGLFWTEADPARVVQVLGNLLANAEKFTPRGGTVVLSLWRDDARKVAIRVRDTGAGIERAMLPHVFESFVQAPRTVDRARGGLGLGLAMVKGIVELHGGSVSVASEGGGRGTEVTLLLPVEASPAPAEAPAAEAPASPRRRVLIIDDNTDNADSLREVLEQDGHDVRVAYDGPTGIALARAFRPAIVVCDIGLPGMDGYAVARAFRADEALRRIPLVAVSGYTQPEDVKRSREAGFDQHLAKPAELEELARLISAAPATPGPDGSEAGTLPSAPDLLH
jgi:two-component system CheB/CheR fusion protein